MKSVTEFDVEFRELVLFNVSDAAGRTSGTAEFMIQHQVSTSLATKPDAASAWGIEDMKLRCRVYKYILPKNKLGNKARNVNKLGALHTPSLRLDFFAPLFVSRQKVEEWNNKLNHLLLTEKRNRIWCWVQRTRFIQRSRCRRANIRNSGFQKE